MPCLKKNKHCKPSLCFMTKKNNYICSGISKKPTKFAEDHIFLCLKGALSEAQLEMTDGEANAFVSVLAASSFGFKELEKEISKKK